VFINPIKDKKMIEGQKEKTHICKRFWWKNDFIWHRLCGVTCRNEQIYQMKKMGYALIVKENEVKHTSQNFSLIHILTF